MELLDRYLQAVRFWLPRAQQQDIIEELRDEINSQIEDKESVLGRALTPDEVQVILKQMGHPMKVASRYQPQQLLIGPVLFPVYRFVLKMVTFGYLAPWLLVWLVLFCFVPSYRTDHPSLVLMNMLGALWSIAFTSFASITLVFAIMERFQNKIKWLENWDPRKLPRVVRPAPAQQVSRTESVFGLAFTIIFVVWWLAMPAYSHQIFGPTDGILVLAPPLHAYYLPVLLLTLVGMAQQGINLYRPQWLWLPPLTRLFTNAIGLGIVTSVAKLYPYVLLVDPAHNGARYGLMSVVINQSVMWSLLCVAIGMFISVIVYAFKSIHQVRRLLHRPRDASSIQISQML
jgi:hypothetical protein